MTETQTTISVGGDVVTLINVFKCAGLHQSALIAALDRATEVLMGVPGFISASIHASADKTRVVNYAQWSSRHAYEAMLERRDVQKHLDDIMRIAETADPRLYTVRSVHHI